LGIGDRNFQHPTVQALISIHDDPHDTVWMVVRRTIAHGRVQYIEFFEDLYESKPFRKINEIQVVTVDATGGTWLARFNGLQTAALAFDITAADLKTALELLDSVSEVLVTGGPGDSGGATPYTFVFMGDEMEMPHNLMTTDAGSLTGGAGTAVVSSEQKGQHPRHPHFVDAGHVQQQVPTNEMQTLTVDATGGTYTLTYNGAPSGVIDYNATAAELEAAVIAFQDVLGATVTGGPGDSGGTTPYVITFSGDNKSTDMEALVTDGTNLTGGAGTATLVVTTEGIPPTTTAITGLERIEGQEVEVVGDGATQTSKTVTGGAITADKVASLFHVGLAYTAEVRTMPIAVAGATELSGSQISLGKVFLRVHESLGGFLGHYGGIDMEPILHRDPTMEMDSPPPVFTGLQEVPLATPHDRDFQLLLRTRNPQPFTLLSMAEVLDIGGS
jgi:hypothetical protein